MLDDEKRVVDELEQQLVTKPLVLVLGIRDWLIYEKLLKVFAETYLSITVREDSPVPLTYKGAPVIMKTNEVKELIQRASQTGGSLPSLTVPTSSGGVRPMSKAERAMEAPEQRRKADLIESLQDDPSWWNGDQFVPTTANAPQPEPNSTASGVTNDIPTTTSPSV